jgi:hypothetical protein
MSDMETYRYLRAEVSTSQLLSLAPHLDFARFGFRHPMQVHSPRIGVHYAVLAHFALTRPNLILECEADMKPSVRCPALLIVTFCTAVTLPQFAATQTTSNGATSFSSNFVGSNGTTYICDCPDSHEV